MIALPGSLGDLVARAERRPIYCAASPAAHRALLGLVIESFRRDAPDGEFVNSRTLYRHADDRRRRWPRERERYSAAIIVTRAEDLPEGADRFAGLAGEHVISIWNALEIEDLAHLGRPIAWHAVVFPAAYWLSRFAIEPFIWVGTSRYAQLVSAADADAFRPVIGSWVAE
jgi:hypothetical protein